MTMIGVGKTLCSVTGCISWRVFQECVSRV